MLLIPSAELKQISNINTHTSQAASGDKGINFDITSAKNYMKLAQDFSHNFYLKEVIPRLEERLYKLLDDTGFKQMTQSLQMKHKTK